MKPLLLSPAVSSQRGLPNSQIPIIHISEDDIHYNNRNHIVVHTLVRWLWSICGHGQYICVSLHSHLPCPYSLLPFPLYSLILILNCLKTSSFLRFVKLFCKLSKTLLLSGIYVKEWGFWTDLLIFPRFPSPWRYGIGTKINGRL